MRTLFHDFKHSHHLRSGPLLATTITPFAPPTEPARLQNFYYGFNSFNISSELRTGLLTPKAELRLPKVEGNAWVDLYVAYSKALGEILLAESTVSQANWSKVYEAWKEVANVLIRGYSNAGFQAWTVPCLYVVGRYLRIFAIKADESLRGSRDDVSFPAGGFQDDVTGEVGKNEKLEDAARVINRIFTLCISDRYVGEIQTILTAHT
jgi:COP9 signalosome complex subunit 12